MTPVGGRSLWMGLAFFIALAWPWDVYPYVPYTSLTASELAAVALVALAGADAISSRRLRVPFELFWPPVAVALCWGVARSADGAVIVGGVLVYFATTHLLGGKEDVQRLLVPSWVSIAVLAGTTLAFRTVGDTVAATAYALERDTLLWGPRSLSGGGWAFLAGLVIAGGISLDTRQRVALRLAAALSIPLMAWAAWPVLTVGLAPDVHPVSLGLARMAALWWVSRIAAKLVIEVEERRGAPTRVLLVLTAMTVLYVILVWPEPRMYHAFLLGLAAAAGKRHETLHPLPRRTWGLAVPLALLVAWNVGTVYPEHRRDPRNYDMAAMQDYEAGQHDTLDARMRHFQRRNPAERRTYSWRARKALAQGDLRRAAWALHAAVQPPAEGERLLLPPPDRNDIEAIKSPLRDALSALERPPGHLAFEAMLAKDGNLDGSLNLLRLHVSPLRPRVPALPPTAFAEAIAFLLRAPEAKDALQAWEPETLVAVLSRCGAIVEPAPSAFPRDRLPLILVADADLETLSIRILSGAQRGDLAIPLEPARRTPPRATLEWEPDLGMTIEGWAFRLQSPDGVLATFELRLDGSHHLYGDNNTAPAALEATSALFVWLPPEDE